MIDNAELKRLNYFTGFFTTADDWTAEQLYHLKKQRLHHQVLHRPGIAEGLDVVPHPNGGLHVRVGKGAALDAHGNLLLLAHDTSVAISSIGSEAATIYLTIQFDEQEEAYRVNVHDPDYSDYTRVSEKPTVLAGTEEPTTSQVELARIHLLSDADQINLPQDPALPKNNEIDRRYVKFVGAVDIAKEARLERLESQLGWVDAYHANHRKLMARRLHNPGVLHGEREEMLVEAAAADHVRILPGAALDANGDLLMLDVERILGIPLADMAPGMVYLVAEYSGPLAGYIFDLPGEFIAELDARRISPAFTAFLDARGLVLKDGQVEVIEPASRWSIHDGGDRYPILYKDQVLSMYAGQEDSYRRNGRPRFRVTQEMPDDLRLELARIELLADAEEISDAADPTNPQPNEIDRRHIRFAGAVDLERDRLISAAKERVAQIHAYHQERQKRQNRGVHFAGILRSVDSELDIQTGDGLTLAVQPGAALDATGNQLYLADPQYITVVPPDQQRTLYIAAQYTDAFTDYLTDMTHPLPGEFSTISIEFREQKPDNEIWVELARVELDPATTEIVEPNDPDSPGLGEIDRRARPFAASLGIAPPRLPLDLRERIDLLMRKTREKYAALDSRFPGPTMGDARQAALQIEMSLDLLEKPQLHPRITTLAAIEQGVEVALNSGYPPVVHKPQFAAYQDAVAALLEALRDGFPLDDLLNRQDAVAQAAGDLAQVVFPPPTAHAGSDITVYTATGEATVMLDATGSEVAEDQQIIHYRWEKER